MSSVELGDLSFVILVAILHAYQAASNAMMVGAARRKFQINPPEMTGPPEFTRTLRVQQNDLEFSMPFQVTLWCSALLCHQVPIALIGLMFVYGRYRYRRGYIEAAELRLKGFMMSVNALKLLMGSCVLGLANLWMKQYCDINVPAMLLEKYYGTK